VNSRHTVVQAVWGVYQRLIQACRAKDLGVEKHLIRGLISTLRQAIPDRLEEVPEPAKILTGSSADILPYFGRLGTSDGPASGRRRTPRVRIR